MKSWLSARGTMLWVGGYAYLLLGCEPDHSPYYTGSGGRGAAGDAAADDASGGRASGGATSKAGGASSGGQGAGGRDAGPSGGGGATSGGATSGGMGSGGAAPEDCDSVPCRLLWPLKGEAAREWVVSNYVDRQSGPGLLDYRGGERTYEGHQGTDIAIASFRAMDTGVPAFAAAPGLVTAVHDGESDRNTIGDPGSCGLVANSVYVQQPDGREARYLHFRKGTIAVQVGQMLATGAQLGEVGSSGCSQSPHLHFELHGTQGELLDPFVEGLWEDAPAYDVAPQVMEVVLVSGVLSSVSDVQLAPPTPASLPGTSFGISVITGGSKVGAVEQVRFYQNDVLRVTLDPYVFDGSERHYMRWWNVSLVPGSWEAEVSLDAETVASVAFEKE